MQILLRILFFPSLACGFLLVGCGEKRGLFSSHDFASIRLGATPQSHGLLLENLGGDGQVKAGRVADEEGLQLVAKEGRMDAYLYLQVEEAFKKRPLPPCTVTLEYFDAAPTEFYLQYDSAIEGKGGGAYSQSKERIETKGLKEWQKAKFVLERPGFHGRQNGKADFRIRVLNANATEFFVRSVTLSQD